MSSRHTLLSGLLFLSLTIHGFGADTGTNGRPEIPDRYLFLVNVSTSMRSRADTIQASITGLLVSGMQGQIQSGDQLGLWTFSDELHTGEFELVEWSEGARNDITRSVLEFLEKQRFSEVAAFSKVMPHLMDVVANSRRITVVLFGDGSEAIQGTPFDGAIANYFRNNAEEIKAKQAPILVVMRGYEGRFIGHTISYPPWPVEFPQFPPDPEPEPELVSAETNVVSERQDLSRTPVTARKGPIVYAEPLIVSGGSKTSTQPVADDVGAQGQMPPVEPATNATATVTDEVAVVVIPENGGPTPEASAETGVPVDKPEPRSGFWTAMKLLGLGFVAVVVVAGGIVLMRRPRARQRTSLISQSMDDKGGSD